MGKVSPDSKSRFAKCRAKKKNSPSTYENYLQKERERKKKARARAKVTMTSEQKEKMRKKTRERVQKWRLKKKEEEKLSSPFKRLGSYSCRNTFGKAVCKARKSLPFSPRKRRAIVRQLVEENFSSEEVFKKPNKAKKVLSESTIQQVISFYESDAISWAAPGKRDYVSVKDPITNKLVKKQKRYLLYRIDEVRSLFEDEFGTEISRSKFFDLRPRYVVPSSKTPHNVCVCVIHANFLSLVDVLQGFLKENFSGHKDLLKALCCDVDSEFCMGGECELCIYDVTVMLKDGIDQSENVKYYEWEKNVNGVFEKIEKVSSLKIVIDKFNDALKEFKFHSFVKSVQSRYFETKKKDLPPGSAVLQVDYAENYGLVFQDEIQAAHWKHSQVSLFTTCLWFEDKVKSYVVVSDDLSHSKESQLALLKGCSVPFPRI